MFYRLPWLGILVLTLSSQHDVALGQAASPVTLKVTVEYEGSGIVDRDHRLVVFVFDTDNIGHEATPAPLATAAAEKNGAVLSFSLGKTPVYLIAYYDKAGTCTADLKELPSGVPAALHGANPAQADPVEITTGRVAEIKITFDDTLILP